MDKMLTGTGAGLMSGSLLVALFLSAVDPLWAGQHLTLMSLGSWLQQALIVLGAALLVGGLVVGRLAPSSSAPSSERRDTPADWFS